jgi:hypothetical protein
MDKEVDAEEVASYIEALLIAIQNGEVKSPEVMGVIQSLPSPSHVRRHISNEEAKILFESVRYAWKEVSGKEITETYDFTPAKESLMGNYWMLKNGLIFHGVNHYGIIKQNITIFSNILDLEPFVVHQKLAGPPDELIKYVIDNGGMRMFITQDKRAFFQMNDQVYANWGRAKVKGFDFPKRVVKLVSASCRFFGWKTGITIRL